MTNFEWSASLLMPTLIFLGLGVAMTSGVEVKQGTEKILTI